MSEKHRVCLIGCGNMGSAVARILGENVRNLPEFEPQIKMFTPVFDKVPGEDTLLADYINEHHENIKYLPGIHLPENIVAVTTIPETAEDADYVVICTPHQFLVGDKGVLKPMIGKIRENATAISLVKGVTMHEDSISLVSETVTEILGIPCGALQGANIANDVAKGDFCESTIAFDDEELGYKWKPLFDQPNFQITVTTDVILQQLCGTIKNIVATGVGFCTGLKLGDSTKAAIIRIGMHETYEFAKWYYEGKNINRATLLESCGVADFICTAYGGRNQRCAAEFVTSGETIQEIEKRVLNGQKLQGFLAARELAKLLSIKGKVKDFPLLMTIYMICEKQLDPKEIVNYRGDHLDRIEIV